MMQVEKTRQAKMRDLIGQVIEKLLLFCAIVSILVVFLIIAFIFAQGWPVIQKYGVSHFLFNLEWRPLADPVQFGLLPMIAGSFAVTFGALLIAVPLGICCAIFLAEFAPQWAAKRIRPGVELLAGIPSVIYGFWALMTLVPFIMQNFGGRGLSILAGSLVLGIMALPFIINIAEDAIRSVPREYKEGSLALGATHWQTVRYVVLPAARSGILAAIILGMALTLGETMAVILVAGNAPVIPDSVLDVVRTLTAHIALEMGYATGEHSQALFVAGMVLFIVIMFLNSIALAIYKRSGAN